MFLRCLKDVFHVFFLKILLANSLVLVEFLQRDSGIVISVVIHAKGSVIISVTIFNLSSIVLSVAPGRVHRLSMLVIFSPR